ncbi:type IX secretion system PorP/SprF family membrane protein [Pedobacter sp. AK017]|uniref:PorP/SprF family type IX secretion system membrane protein n=1 Tax=Pedobacter sp. AK017 TaxID=2723073 RepID=UPI0016184AF8|nr:type IX secretion system membrane protein PorP/SprF [Pedobacter sp. AK017]MBB5441003.1 type IX secretion system PorP/SprF family membrane protein [Pedobacter sp. AK017]
MKKQFILLAALFTSISQLVFGQQDAQFSQYLFNGIYINPAYAGYKEVLNVHSFYRSQWTGITGAPKTASIAVDAIANDGNVGLALQALNDRLGAQQNNAVYLSYAYRIRFNAEGSSRLAFGLSGGMAQYGIDADKLSTNDPESSFNASRNLIVPNAAFGVYFANDKYFAGISADNLIASQYNDEKFRNLAKPQIHAYLTAGMLVPLTTNIKLKPSFLLKEDFAGPTNLDLNAFILFGESLWLGGSYRTGVKLWDKPHLQRNLSNSDALVAAIEVFPQSNIRLGYAYDFSVGPLQGYSGGSHEFSLAYYFGRTRLRMATQRVF